MIVRQSLASSWARALERGPRPSILTTLLAGSWASRARVVRELALPPSTSVVGVSGPTLGGSYKTPLVVSLARALRERGAAVAVVSHGYRARPGPPREVRPGDPVRAVSDDALAAARALAPDGVPVVVGARRQEALGFAASRAGTLVVDGLLQTAPAPVALSVLAVDARRPWGAGRCPPEGDLRARPEALLEACDAVVRIQAGAEPAPRDFPRTGRPVFEARFHLDGAMDAQGRIVPFAALSGARIGLVLAVARPERVLRSLAEAGVSVVEARWFSDHATPRPRGKRPVDLWLTTDKCRTKLAAHYDGAEVLTLSSRIALPKALVDLALERADPGLRPRRDLARALPRR